MHTNTFYLKYMFVTFINSKTKFNPTILRNVKCPPYHHDEPDCGRHFIWLKGNLGSWLNQNFLDWVDPDFAEQQPVSG